MLRRRPHLWGNNIYALDSFDAVNKTAELEVFETQFVFVFNVLWKLIF